MARGRDWGVRGNDDGEDVVGDEDGGGGDGDDDDERHGVVEVDRSAGTASSSAGTAWHSEQAAEARAAKNPGELGGRRWDPGYVMFFSSMAE